VLKSLSFILGYRFHDFLYPKPSLPYTASGLDPKEIREKARASSAVVGVFLAFLAGLLCAIVTVGDVIDRIRPVDGCLLLSAAAMVFLSCFVLREQRKISAAPWEAKAWKEKFNKSELERETKKKKLRRRHTWAIFAGLLLYVSLFLFWPWASPPSRAFGLAGVFLALAALFFLIFSIELYDTAGSWQKADNTEYHFHMASLASHCYVLGLAMTLVGFSLVLRLQHLKTGFWLSLISLVFLNVMSGVERELSDIST